MQAEAAAESAQTRRVGKTSSTMDDARTWASAGAPHLGAVVADAQSAGRGRVPGRVWHAAPGESLLATLILRFPSPSVLPAGLPLRAGLAALLALEDSVPALSRRLSLKWPNDVLVRESGRKLCGVLCEASPRFVLVGAGFNLLQRSFPPELEAKASSALLESGDSPDRFAVLDAFRRRLAWALSLDLWKEAAEERLYRRGTEVSFEDGAADSGRLLKGRLEGLGPAGELRLRLGGEERDRLFPCGELKVYGDAGGGL